MREAPPLSAPSALISVPMASFFSRAIAQLRFQSTPQAQQTRGYFETMQFMALRGGVLCRMQFPGQNGYPRNRLELDDPKSIARESSANFPEVQQVFLVDRWQNSLHAR
jgi:hypothetical protein